MKTCKAFVLSIVLASSIFACTLPTPTPDVGEPPTAPLDLYVTTSGSDSNDCLSVETACVMIQTALRHATPYSTVHVGAGTFNVTSSGIDPLVPVTIRGAGMDSTTVLSDRSFVFIVSRASDVTIEDLTMSRATTDDSTSTTGMDARVPGGQVTLRNCRIENNLIGLRVFEGSTVSVSNCQIQDNQSGVVNYGQLTLDSATVQRNATESGNAVLNGVSGQMTITNSRIVRNGVFNRESGAGSPAVVNLGQLEMDNVEISNNISYGFILQSGTVSATNSQIVDNGNMGLWHIEGQFTGQNMIFQDNGAYGVAIGGRSSVPDAGVLRLSQSAIVSNGSSGLRMDDGEVHLQNVTISGNVASSSGGGGIWGYGGTLILLDSTVAYNTGHGIEVGGEDVVVTARRSVVALNSEAECLIDPRVTMSSFPTIFFCDDSWTRSTLRLNALTEDNGTLVHPLANGSPLINAAGPASTCPASDQRGIARPVGETCDVGAYEFPSVTAAIVAATPEETQGIIPLITDTPTSQPPAGLVNKNSNCRKGPGARYHIVTAFEVNTNLLVESRNEQNTWWLVTIPTGGNCWISADNLDENSDLGNLLVGEIPLLPFAPAQFNVKEQSCIPKQKFFSLTLRWVGGGGETGFRLYLNGKKIEDFGADKTSYKTSPPLDKDLAYELEAINANGASDRVQLFVSACK